MRAWQWPIACSWKSASIGRDALTIARLKRNRRRPNYYPANKGREDAMVMAREVWRGIADAHFGERHACDAPTARALPASPALFLTVGQRVVPSPTPQAAVPTNVSLGACPCTAFVHARISLSSPREIRSRRSTRQGIILSLAPRGREAGAFCTRNSIQRARNLSDPSCRCTATGRRPRTRTAEPP